jgi:hypothetical protein
MFRCFSAEVGEDDVSISLRRPLAEYRGSRLGESGMEPMKVR